MVESILFRILVALLVVGGAGYLFYWLGRRGVPPAVVVAPPAPPPPVAVVPPPIYPPLPNAGEVANMRNAIGAVTTPQAQGPVRVRGAIYTDRDGRTSGFQEYSTLETLTVVSADQRQISGAGPLTINQNFYGVQPANATAAQTASGQNNTGRGTNPQPETIDDEDFEA